MVFEFCCRHQAVVLVSRKTGRESAQEHLLGPIALQLLISSSRVRMYFKETHFGSLRLSSRNGALCRIAIHHHRTTSFFPSSCTPRVHCIHRPGLPYQSLVCFQCLLSASMDIQLIVGAPLRVQHGRFVNASRMSIHSGHSQFRQG